ncbi:MAG: hypothetical protein WAK17_01935 [Candidatus Nitrosopolaris sp.]
MQTIALLLPLLLLVTPAIAHGQQATITAPQGEGLNHQNDNWGVRGVRSSHCAYADTQDCS